LAQQPLYRDPMRERVRPDFWSAFADYAAKRGHRGRWNRRTSLRRVEGRLIWAIRVRQTDGEAELLIERGSRQENGALFADLKVHEREINDGTQLPLRWSDKPNRIRFRIAGPKRAINTSSARTWPTAWDTLLADLQALEQAIRPFLGIDAAWRRLRYDAPDWNVGLLLADSQSETWGIHPGDLVRRTELHAIYGGRRQGGIGPSATTKNVLVFSDPTAGARYGYNDRWEGAVFHYTGEGQVGDQRMTGGNRAILEHQESGRVLRLFKGVRGVVRYEGEFRIESDLPWYEGHAPDRNGRMRRVIIFRIRAIEQPYPMAERTYDAAREGATTFGVRSNAVNEDIRTAPSEPFALDPNVIDRGTKGHNRTQNLLRSFLENKGVRTMQPNAALDDPDFDLGWERGGVWFVAEVKSLTDSNETQQLRLAIGQVLDYQDRLSRRHSDVRAVIAVERAIRDRRWVALCERHNVILVWPETFEVAFSKVLSR